MSGARVTFHTVRALIAAASREAETHKFTIAFLVSEWTQVVDAWQIETWEAYRDVPRLGRKTRLSEKQRTLMWCGCSLG